MTSTPLYAQQVSKTYLLGQTEVHALKQIELEVKEHEFLALAGTSGSGKTTLLNLFGCIDQPTKGKIFVDGTDVSSMNSDELAHFRSKKIGFIFQTFNLLPILSAEENVEYPLLLNQTPVHDRKRLVADALAKVGLSKYADHRPDQMSGGQRQRVAIARALVKNPRIILADEPTANLDKKTAMEILQLMKHLNQSEGVTFVFSTHDSLVLSLASRIYRMSDGQHISGDGQ